MRPKKPPRTLLILHHSLEHGGAERQLLLLLKNLAVTHKTVLVLYTLPKVANLLFQEFPHVTVHGLKGGLLPQPIRFFVRFYSLVRICRKHKPRILLSYLVGTNITNLLIGKLLGIEKVV